MPMTGESTEPGGESEIGRLPWDAAVLLDSFRTLSGGQDLGHPRGRRRTPGAAFDVEDLFWSATDPKCALHLSVCLPAPEVAAEHYKISPAEVLSRILGAVGPRAKAVRGDNGNGRAWGGDVLWASGHLQAIELREGVGLADATASDIVIGDGLRFVVVFSWLADDERGAVFGVYTQDMPDNTTLDPDAIFRATPRTHH